METSMHFSFKRWKNRNSKGWTKLDTAVHEGTRRWKVKYRRLAYSHE
jgi:hypothetical protein